MDHSFWQKLYETMGGKMMERKKIISLGMIFGAFIMCFILTNQFLLKDALSATASVQSVYKYQLNINGKPVALFAEMYNAGTEHEIIEQKVADSQGKTYIKKIPGRLKYTNIVLKGGISKNLEIASWRQKVLDGKINEARSAVTIVMRDQMGNELASWNLANCWPSKLIYNPVEPLNESAGAPQGVEMIELVFENILRTK